MMRLATLLCEIIQQFRPKSTSLSKKNFLRAYSQYQALQLHFFEKLNSRFLRSATFRPLGRGLSFGSRRLEVVQRGVETQTAHFQCCSINRKTFRLVEKNKKTRFFFKEGALWEPPTIRPFHLGSSNFFSVLSDSDPNTLPNLVKIRGM